MKKIAAVMFSLTTIVLFSAGTIRGADQCPVSSGEFDKLVQSNFKNQCLIVAKNCTNESNTVQQRVDQLRQEIAKGQDVYTPSELRTLKEQLEWIASSSGNQFI